MSSSNSPSRHRGSVFTPTELAYLGARRLARLATIDSRGRPQNSPVGLHYNPSTDTIDIIGWNLAKSRKYRNVVNNPYVSLVADDMPIEGQPRGIEIRGRGQPISEPDLTTGARAVIRVHPDRIISWGLAELEDSTHDPGFPVGRDARGRNGDG